MIHDTRIIPLDGRPHLGVEHPALSWGIRAGAGKAMILMVETSNLTDQTSIGPTATVSVTATRCG